MKGLRRLVALGAALALTGCLTELRRPYPEKTRYTLEVERSPQVRAGPAPLGEAVLRVRQVYVASLFERKGFVYRIAETRYETDFYNELYAPPGVVFHEELVEWLRASGLFAQVVGGGSMEAADWLLDVHIQELYADLRESGSPEAVLRFDFALRAAGAPSETKPALREGHVLREPAARAAAEPLVDAWSALLAEAFRRIETALRRFLLAHAAEIHGDTSPPISAVVAPAAPESANDR